MCVEIRFVFDPQNATHKAGWRDAESSAETTMPPHILFIINIYVWRFVKDAKDTRDSSNQRRKEKKHKQAFAFEISCLFFRVIMRDRNSAVASSTRVCIIIICAESKHFLLHFITIDHYPKEWRIRQTASPSSKRRSSRCGVRRISHERAHIESMAWWIVQKKHFRRFEFRLADGGMAISVIIITTCHNFNFATMRFDPQFFRCSIDFSQHEYRICLGRFFLRITGSLRMPSKWICIGFVVVPSHECSRRYSARISIKL